MVGQHWRSKTKNYNMIVPNQTISLSIDIRHSPAPSQTQDTDLGELHIYLEIQTYLFNVSR